MKSLVFEHLDNMSYGISTRPSKVGATFWGVITAIMLHMTTCTFVRGVLNTWCHITCKRSSNKNT